MVGLIDLAPQSENVEVRNMSVAVYGISAKGLADTCWERFPELRRLMSGQDLAAESLLAMSGDAVAAIIAAGCWSAG